MENKYLTKLSALIASYPKKAMAQFRSRSLEQATFDDMIWLYIDPATGRRTKFLCGQSDDQIRDQEGDLVSDRKILPPYDYLVKVWIIETCNVQISALERVSRVTAARKLLTAMKGGLYNQTKSSIMDLHLAGGPRLQAFLKFCFEKGLMPKIVVDNPDRRDRTGHASLDREKSKLPDIKSIVAIATIFQEIFDNVDDNGVVLLGKEVSYMDALATTFALLSLASPNRLAAEVSVLPKQYLQKYSELGGQAVHYLDWIGSKGFQDNKNHVLSSLSKPLDKALKFFVLTCEPARILCRFYEHPTRPLGELLGGYRIEPRFQSKLNLKAVPNIFSLGYALGFYDVDECVPVVEMVEPGSRISVSRNIVMKPIYSLEVNDLFTASRNRSSRSAALPRLFKYECLPDFFECNYNLLSVGLVQSAWIRYFRNSMIPEFPISYGSGESSMTLSDAMFCSIGHMLYGPNTRRGAGTKRLQSSIYSIVPLGSMALSACRRLGGKYGLSIFEKYGFSPEHKLSPHTLRHFINTLADVSDIPVELITAWSGRVNSDQTHTYIHTHHSEKIAKVSAVMNPPATSSRSVRVISKEDLVGMKNIPASVTSTGICIQDLNVTPCEYLNDFFAQCFKCRQACYVAGDRDAIDFLSRDFHYQSARLGSIFGDVRLQTSRALQQWYVIHSNNVHLLKELLHLMNVQPIGALISYNESNSEFVVMQITSGVTTKVTCALPNAHAELQHLLNDGNSQLSAYPNTDLAQLLRSFEIAPEGGSDGNV